MMRSLFSGVSGLKNHQTRMDVIGNNISNVNTTGFKSARATFTDMLSQTLSGAAAPAGNVGGVNPKQIGLGSSVSAVETLFTNGSVQSTGKNTDLCLSSENALFILNTGSGTAYTRNGAFEFDADGNYVQAGNGYFVQGWMAKDGILSTTGAVEKITIPSGKQMESKTTTSLTYSNNLNADTTGYEIAGIQVTYKDGTSETRKTYAPGASTNSITVNGKEYKVDSGTYVTGQTLTNQVVWESEVESITVSGAGQAELTCDTGGYLAVNGGTGAVTVNPSSGTYSKGSTYSVTKTIKQATLDSDASTVLIEFNETSDGITSVKVPKPPTGTYEAGQSFTVSLGVSDGTAKTGSTVKAKNGESDTVTTGTYAFGDSYSCKVTGTVEAVTNGSTEEVSSVMITTADGKTITGLTGGTYSKGETFYPSVVTSAPVYDSIGASHDVSLLFTKSSANTWKLSLAGGGTTTEITEDDGSITKITLTSDDLKFDSYGKYVSGTASLSISYGNGAADQTVAVNLAALTQYASSNTIAGLSDGNAPGTLSSVSIDTSGAITGTYTNGVKQVEAQVAVQRFTNPAGLTKVGDSLYEDSNNAGKSGEPNTAAAIGAKITPAALEMSNVDVADQFSDMIVTQRGFQTNSKIITVSDEMLETLINMKR